MNLITAQHIIYRSIIIAIAAIQTLTRIAKPSLDRDNLINSEGKGNSTWETSNTISHHHHHHHRLGFETRHDKSTSIEIEKEERGFTAGVRPIFRYQIFGSCRRVISEDVRNTDEIAMDGEIGKT